MNELREKFEKSEFYKRALLDIAKPHIYFEDNEYKGPTDFQTLIIRLNSGWHVFQEQREWHDYLRSKASNHATVNEGGIIVGEEFDSLRGGI